MYLESLREKIAAKLQSNPTLVHSQLIEELNHNERQALLDTVREMEKRGVLTRDLSEKNADGKSILRYLRKV